MADRGVPLFCPPYTWNFSTLSGKTYEQASLNRNEGDVGIMMLWWFFILSRKVYGQCITALLEGGCYGYTFLPLVDTIVSI
jgi:hypothetical protein